MAKDKPMEADLKHRVEKRHRTRFWGRTYMVKPRLVDEIFGDGKKLFGIEPLNSRPNYYVIRGDSKWDVSNWADGETIGQHIEEILESIEEQFGRAWYDDDPPQRKSGRPFPALNDDVGVGWFEVRL